MIDLLESGRTSWVEAEMCPCSTLPSKGKWTKLGGVTGGSLDWKYFSTMKTSGQLSVVGAKMPTNCYIRVYYCMKLGNEQERDLLGTYYADPQSGSVEDGLYTGTVKLVSTLQRYEDYKLYQNITLKKREPAKTFADRVMKMFGGEYVNGLGNSTVGLANGSGHDVVYEFGTKAMDILQDIAVIDNSRVSVDEYGRLLLWKMPYRDFGKLVQLDGVDVDESGFGTPNVAAVRQNVEVQKKYEKPIIGTASLDPSAEWSASKAGRKVVATYDLTDTKKYFSTSEDKIKNMYDYQAKNRLSKFSGGITKTTLRIPYARVKLGDHVNFEGYNGYEWYGGGITAISMNLDGPMGVMKVTISDSLADEAYAARASEIRNG